ncbi:MAG: transporter substrate-binding domain-containing protein, partial [Proteobacteria bacterium]|nr:transporter substrate-binding domain-containing protein [Pseudomonadota bacterium]
MGKTIRIVESIILIVLVQWVATSVSFGETTLKVGIYPDEPLMFVNEEGKVTGLIVESLEYVAAKKGWTIEYVPSTREESLASLQKGEIDLVAVEHSLELDQLVDISTEPILLVWAQVYVHNDSDIQTVLDLKGNKVAVRRNDQNAEELKALIRGFNPRSIVVEAENYAEVLGLISEKKVLAGVVDNFYGIKYQKEYDVKVSPILFKPQSIVFAAPKGRDGHLLDTLDAYLSALKDNQNSFYYQSLEKWFGSKYDTSIPDWVIWAGGAAWV